MPLHYTSREIELYRLLAAVICPEPSIVIDGNGMRAVPPPVTEDELQAMEWAGLL